MEGMPGVNGIQPRVNRRNLHHSRSCDFDKLVCDAVRTKVHGPQDRQGFNASVSDDPRFLAVKDKAEVEASRLYAEGSGRERTARIQNRRVRERTREAGRVGEQAALKDHAWRGRAWGFLRGDRCWRNRWRIRPQR